MKVPPADTRFSIENETPFFASTFDVAEHTDDRLLVRIVAPDKQSYELEWSARKVDLRTVEPATVRMGNTVWMRDQVDTVHLLVKKISPHIVLFQVLLVMGRAASQVASFQNQVEPAERLAALLAEAMALPVRRSGLRIASVESEYGRLRCPQCGRRYDEGDRCSLHVTVSLHATPLLLPLGEREGDGDRAAHELMDQIRSKNRIRYRAPLIGTVLLALIVLCVWLLAVDFPIVALVLAFVGITVITVVLLLSVERLVL